MNNNIYFKPYKGYERENYLFLEGKEQKEVVPKFELTDTGIRLELGTSIYPYITLDNSCFKWIYDEAISKFHKLRCTSFSPGIYSFITLSDNVLNDKQIKDQYYIEYIATIESEILQMLNLKDSIPLEFKSIHDYITNIYTEYWRWCPKSEFRLLHGDLKLSNLICKDGKPLLIDLEYMRYGAPELELSNLLVQLYGDKFPINSEITWFIKAILKKKNCFGDIDYEFVKDVGIPIILMYRYAYALAGKLAYYEVRKRVYPLIWKDYVEVVL